MNTALAVAVPIGIGFGWTLERAGLGTAPKLAGQFALTDLTVFKVMFGAVVTAMLGAFWLARMGFLDLQLVYVPETYILPQLVGGLLFGAGFSLCGLCPGTSCVAAASGRGDGAMVMLGMFAGVLAAGLSIERLGPLYESTAHGSWTLPELLHLPYGVIVCAVTGMALTGFRGAEWIEKRSSDREARTTTRSVRRTFTAVAAALGVLAVFAGSPPRTDEARLDLTRADIAELAAEVVHEKDHITPLELTEWIRDGKTGLRVIDVRTAEEHEIGRIPRAESIDLEALVAKPFQPTDTIVLYSSEGVHAGQAWVLLRSLGYRQVFFLRGGWSAWLDEVKHPTPPGSTLRQPRGC